MCEGILLNTLSLELKAYTLLRRQVPKYRTSRHLQAL